MRIEIDKNRKGLVRVVLGISNRNSSCVSTNYEDCEKRGNIRAVGFWHRHDDKNIEDKLSKECTLLLDAYGKMFEYAGAIIGIEWKDYRKS